MTEEKINSKYDGIICVDENGRGHLIKMITKEEWKITDHDEYDCLEEIEFKAEPGLYYANMSGKMCGGAVCTSYECPGDCFETNWELVMPPIVLVRDFEQKEVSEND